MTSRRALLAALLVALWVLFWAAPDLGGPPFLPEEAGHLLAHPLALARLLRAAARSGLSPETLARLPALAAATLAAAAVALAGAAEGTALPAAIAAMSSPVFIATARLAGAEAIAVLLGALAVMVISGPTPAGRIRAGIAGLLIAAGMALAPGFTHSSALAGETVLAAAFSTWGVLFGPAIPPWRIDVVLPALAVALPLLWIGAGRTTARRSFAVGALAAGCAALGLLAPRATFASLDSAALTPLALLWMARGSARLPARVPRWPLAAVALGAGMVGALDLHAARDVLDPARRVRWDEAARMLATLAAGDAVVVARPALPAPLLVYVQGDKLAVADLPANPGPARVLVVSNGVRGGLGRATAPIEDGLETGGYDLAGELELGELEPGFQSLLRTLFGVPTPSKSYLRFRRYERRGVGAEGANTGN